MHKISKHQPNHRSTLCIMSLKLHARIHGPGVASGTATRLILPVVAVEAPWQHLKQQQQQQQYHAGRQRRCCCHAAVSGQDASPSPAAAAADDLPSTSGRQPAVPSQPPGATHITLEEVQQLAAARGLHISLKTLGPAYRIVCRDGGEDGKVLGVTSGFVAPLFGLMHCDTLQIFTKGMKGEHGLRVRQNALGLGLLLGAAVFAHGRSCGCRKAEILAINDDDAWHERLVRYYSYFGFKPVCKVGGNGFFADVPHLLVWGGEGTRMDADIDEMLAKWGPALRKRRNGAAQQPQQQQSPEEQQA